MEHVEALCIAMAQHGDAEAFARLVDFYQTPVYNLCHRMLGDSGEAEDAAQEAFLRAYKNILRYDDKRPFATWLLAIAAHYCIDQLRKRRMNVVSVEDLPPQAELPDPTPNPESVVSGREQQSRVQALLNSLSEVDRAAVVMYYWYEYSYEEIAQTLDLTVSAVKSRLHRARRTMAEAWTGDQRQTALTEAGNHGEIRSPVF